MNGEPFDAIADDLRRVVMAAAAFHSGFTLRRDVDTQEHAALAAAIQRTGALVDLAYTVANGN